VSRSKHAVAGAGRKAAVHHSSQAHRRKTIKALWWHGKGDIRCDDVPDPKVEHGRDAIIKMTACAICR
jgi:hypothetical protein